MLRARVVAVLRARIVAVAADAGRAALALFFLLLLASTLRLDGVPWVVPCALVALTALTVRRPSDALLVVAALVPIAGYADRWWSGSVNWPETLVIAFAAGWWIRALIRSKREGPLPTLLRTPIVVFVLVICSSVLVQVSLEQVRLGAGGACRMLWHYFSRTYFVSGSNDYVHAAAFLLEGLLLFSAAARLIAANSLLRGRLAAAMVASLAVATALNLERLAASASRSTAFWSSLAALASAVRTDLHYGDVNAAGSVLAMALPIALALALAGRRSRAWFGAAALLTIGLWMSGSRTAQFAVPVAAGAVLLAAYGQGRAGARAGVRWTAMLLALVAVAVLAYAPMRGNQQSSSVAARVRIEMARTTLRMVAQRPIFGIGIGQFSQRSGEFSSPELLQLFPPARHENAHNNFLQVLGEMGLAGLAAFVWVLAVVLYHGWRNAADDPASLGSWAALAGVVAFLLTCLGGHPLLTREPAYLFWITTGLVAATRPAARSSARAATPRTNMYLVTAAVIILAASLPIRARQQAGDADLEHLGVHVSLWQSAEDGVRYRRSTNDEATVFVPRGAAGFLVRLRTTTAPADVELWLDGRLINVVRVEPARWTEVRMPLPRDAHAPRFSPLRIRSTPRQPLMIGKVEPL